MQLTSRLRAIARVLVTVGLAASAIGSHAAMEPKAAASADGWQLLSAGPKPVAAAAAPTTATGPAASATALAGSSAVAPVVLAGADDSPAASAAATALTFTVMPQDVNLRDALDRWLKTQGWQLAWKIDDDLPLEFNATFTGDFKSVLEQVMKATNHMRTPTRACRHTNNVIRVIARAGNCQD
ncbi:TPA: toxin co-regulated pilus biosynthesis Q family protein [Burkholderia vietnamiensis]|uniref:toxin co-regulated pilus biosynthesis Q family protein n=1 Tax=Burkholderia vietnamiensis TaxID=60552 RepID=UPI001B9EE526|nr:toxin co-regulated pilus biosynthesis Q family protein [Burkholderia vietnamiensis]MBR8359615.1 toxin co-regulated pilus biosynthesis Q family protein [Burkholderia vietnamiensis]UKV71510.1 toxin co-regulated pilus biosynthesis Q family protein [Burkholderia vietnamiensis]HDR9060631.1 toxin co-regulated pilus biosynthesis Q family protein [Burkholderia vietnamiensis]HDR9157623.1 toxin co-regulated pilus biosynthesis Q family protein [Burkholderia vietnamiensis]